MNDIAKQKANEATRKWRMAHPERAKAVRRRWRLANAKNVRETNRAWRLANPERVKELERERGKANSQKRKERDRRWRAAHPDFSKEYYKANRDKRLEKAREWHVANREEVCEKHRIWRQANPDKVKANLRKHQEENRAIWIAYGAKRRALRIQAIPKWANHDKIRKLYRKAHRLGLVVDHIVPLNSRVVCGLHWEGNLQLLTAEENAHKTNKLLINSSRKRRSIS